MTNWRELLRCAGTRDIVPPPVESTPELWPNTVDSAKLLADLTNRSVATSSSARKAVRHCPLHGDVLDHDAVATQSPMRRYVCRCWKRQDHVAGCSRAAVPKPSHGTDLVRSLGDSSPWRCGRETYPVVIHPTKVNLSRMGTGACG